MSAAAERIQRAHDLVRKHRHTPLFAEALAHLRDVVDAVKREVRTGDQVTAHPPEAILNRFDSS